MNLDNYVQKVTGHATPSSWQTELAAEAAVRNRLIRISIGMGKTLRVLLALIASGHSASTQINPNKSCQQHHTAG